ncbi:hypothetical protein FEM48_Zijuj03G0048700 [Ziziphus jujuba var. spinosa]|uniref:Uncharacterized protein n=1 Tax=Ziziphus jujuba var. spinosa TaxID=714518 RepID=A0A978VNA2_ZIZJJ|nr:hypothetical protein FEM48_Zijuj03G0048700 [Ziziphus jujuba var. spinosa]
MKQGRLCFSVFLRDPGLEAELQVNTFVKLCLYALIPGSGYKSIRHPPNRPSIPGALSTVVALAFHVLAKHARGGSILMPARRLHLNCGPLPEKIKLICIQGIRLLFGTRQARLLSCLCI